MKNLTCFLLYVTLFLSVTNLHSQLAPDFTIIDTHGESHSLYEDYLDQGKTVLLDFFFVDCPPCNSYAPHLQSLYEDWGEGEFDVQFISLSTKTFDSNADVSSFENQHGITFPGAGEDGGGYDATTPYTSGTFGSFWGSPSYAIISPDGMVRFGVSGSGIAGTIAALDEAIADTGATGGDTTIEDPDPAFYTINVHDKYGNDINNVEFTLTSTNPNSPVYNLNLGQGNTISFNHFSEAFSGIENPVIIANKNDDTDAGISSVDIILIFRHILSLDIIHEDLKLLACDANDDGKISASDMAELRKIILNVNDEFPNNTSWKFFPAVFPIDVTPGIIGEITFEGIKIGNINY